MQFKTLAFAALASTAYSQDLVSVLQGAPQLANLTTYLSAVPDLVSTLGGLTNITLLAPNNAAFAEFLNSSTGAGVTEQTGLLEAIFTYHVLNGSYPTINETAFIPTALQPPTYANVTGGQVVQAIPGDDGGVTFLSGLLANASVVSESPLNFTGGVIHIIDSVLTIPQNISETAIQSNLSSIVGALTAADLVATVDGTPDLTVFVPNNAAFQAIGSALPNLTTEQVTDILSYHVVAGTVGYSTLLENGTSLQTLQGNNVTIRIVDEEVYVNGARVVLPNVLVANGVVHVIDNVLNPANATASDSSPDDGAGSPAFEGASSASAPPFTSGVPTPTATLSTAAVASSQASAAATSSSEGIAMPMKTGAVGAAALFGGAALAMNW